MNHLLSAQPKPITKAAMLAFAGAALILLGGCQRNDVDLSKLYKDQAVSMVKGHVQNAGLWKRHQVQYRGAEFDGPDDFRGVQWEDLFPVPQRGLLDYEQEGDVLRLEGKWEAEIVSRRPLVVDLRMPKYGRRAKLQLIGSQSAKRGSRGNPFGRGIEDIIIEESRM